jgi:hypothetical protein
MTAADGEALARIVVATVREYVARHCDAIAQETRSTWAALKDDLTATRERLAVVEVRQPIAASPGDGLGDLRVEHDGERTFTITCVRGADVTSLGSFTIPIPLYRDVWTEGRTYEPGDSVTSGGSEWHCRATTTGKPGACQAWTLKVKKGRDGKDGAPGAIGPAGPAGRDWQQVYDDTRTARR